MEEHLITAAVAKLSLETRASHQYADSFVRNLVASLKASETSAPVTGSLTKAELVETLDCFWNAAIGHARHSDDYVVLKTVGAIAEGISAMTNHLREGDV